MNHLPTTAPLLNDQQHATATAPLPSPQPSTHIVFPASYINGALRKALAMRAIESMKKIALEL